MKRTFFLTMSLMFLSVLGCSSATKNPNACVVQTGSGTTQQEVTVEDGVAFLGAGCITGKFGCKYKETRFDGDSIVIEGELSPFSGKVATFKNENLILKPEKALPALVTSFAGETKATWGDRKVTLTRNGGSPVVYNYLGACSKKDVALGITNLYYSN